MEDNSNKIEEQALDILANEENISNDIIQQLEDNIELLDTLRDAQMMRSIVTGNNIHVDIEARLSDFHSKHAMGKQRKVRKHEKYSTYYIYTAIAAAAATILCFFMLYHSEKPAMENASVIVFEAEKQPTECVTLKTQSGKIININDRQTSRNKAYSTPVTEETNAGNNIEIMVLAVPYGESFDITLPDGTVAYVHPGSQLTFPSSFNDGKRTVRLNGEAYFKVAKDPQHPFVVKTEKFETVVLGTEFDVTAYSDQPAKITLITGSVNVRTSTENLKLTPGEQASVGENFSISVENTDVSEYTMWRDGYLYYDNMTLEDIMRSIGKTYNLSVAFYNKEHLGLRMRFIAERHSSIESILNTLNNMNKIQASVSNGVIIVK